MGLLLLFTIVTSGEEILESIVINAGLLLLLVAEKRLLSLPILFFNKVDKPGLTRVVEAVVLVGVVAVCVSIIVLLLYK